MSTTKSSSTIKRSTPLPNKKSEHQAVLLAYLDLWNLATLDEDRTGRVSSFREELNSLQRCASKTLIDMKNAFPWLPDGDVSTGATTDEVKPA